MSDIELVPHNNTNAEDVAEYYDQNEALEDPATRRDYFAHLEADDFIDQLQQVGSMVRTGDSMQRQDFDGDRVGLAGYEVPDHADKVQLLKDTWNVAKSFLADPKLSDEDALTYAGLTVGGGILYAHAFADGNGRSSRVVSHMIMEGNSPQASQDLERMLNEGGESEWKVTPTGTNMNECAGYNPDEKVENWPADVSWSADIVQKMKNNMSGRDDDAADRIISSQFELRALHHLMANMDQRGRSIIDAHTTYDEEGKADELRADLAVRDLTMLPEGGIGYAAQIVEAQRWARADSVHRFLRAMQEDAAHRPTNQLDRQVRQIDSPEYEANDRELALSRAFGKYAVGNLITPRDHFRVLHDSHSGIKRDRPEDADEEQVA